MWVQVKLITMTLFLTGLIWIYADQAVKETDALALSVRLHAGKDVIPTVVDPPGGMVSLTVSGSAKDVSQARKDAQAGLLHPLDIAVPDLDRGTHAIDLIEQIQDNDLLAERNLTLVAVTPAELLIDVDRWTRQEVKLTPITPVGMLFVDSPAFDPPTVTVTYPASRKAELELDAGLPIAIGQYVQDKAPGERLAIPVAMPTVVGDPQAQISCEPSEVILNVILRTVLIEDDLEDSVPIHILAPQDLFGQYQAEFRRPAFARPRLSGTREALTALTSAQVRAFVSLTADDVRKSLAQPETWLSRPVEYRFPSKDIAVLGKAEMIEFRIKARP